WRISFHNFARREILRRFCANVSANCRRSHSITRSWKKRTGSLWSKPASTGTTSEVGERSRDILRAIPRETPQTARSLRSIPPITSFSMRRTRRSPCLEFTISLWCEPMNGAVGLAANDALQFVEKRRAILRCPVVTWDERLSTVAAERALRDAGKKTHQTRGYVDQVAAQMILQGYLDRRQSEAPAEESTRGV